MNNHHHNIMVSTDHDDEHENDVYFKFNSSDTHLNFHTQIYLHSWLMKSGIKYEVLRHYNDEMRILVWSKEDRVKLRMAFQLVKDRSRDDYVSTYADDQMDF